ncbi:PiggyBac transposable element-derived protein 4 [Cucumispora dikerogammari]|nr:PiggyBac transposable element-derived protein 4 [Cucumispora dikerogammari]
MDNYYNSVSLAQSLISDKIYCCDTMRMRREEPEHYTKDKRLMKKNDFKCAQKGGVNILLWYDKKVVCFLSTFINIEENVRDVRKVYSKPNKIRVYDQNMGEVDIYDQMIKSYYNVRK